MEKVILFAGLMALALAGSAFAKDTFLISHWFGPAEATREKFAEAAEANFNVILFAGDVEQNQKALELCQELGVKGMIYDSRILAKGDRERGFKKHLDTIVSDYAGYPALWGYVVADEPNADDFVKLGAINKYLLSKNSRRVPFINLFPTYASSGQLGKPTCEHYVDEYMRVVCPRILSFDHYPLMKEGPDRPDYFENLEIIRRQGIKHKTPFFTTPLSLGHGPYRDPSDADLRWQVNTALAYGARGVMYFTYRTFSHDPNWNWGEAIINMDGSRNRKYEEVKRINGELLKLAPTLTKLTSVAVYHTGAVPSGAKPLPEDGLVRRIDGGEFVVGQFNAENGGRYAMLVNKSFKSTARANIAFSQRVKLYEVSRATGRQRGLPVRDEQGGSAWRADFRPGEGRLVRIELVDDLPVRSWEDPPHFRPRVMLNPSAQFGNIIPGDNEGDPHLYVEALNMYDVALKVRDELIRDGRVDVFVSREDRDQQVTLEQETDLTRSLNCDVLVSLHSDATGTDDPGGGTWTFYADDVEGKRLAECVQSPLLEAIGTFYPEVFFRGIRHHWYRLWVLHEAGCPASLTEVLFHSNPTEREMLKNPQYQDLFAKAIAKGILDYFGLR